MKNLINIAIISCLLLIIHACCKEKLAPMPIEPAKDDCKAMYDTRSKPYINPYTGTLITGGFYFSFKYLDKYQYWYPCMNPNNDFEFCFARRENGVQLSDDMDLYKYNFCTGKATLITAHVAYGIDWSVKDWIIFTGTDRQVWKVKSNGDSLKVLPFKVGNDAKINWNTSGKLFIRNDKYICDEEGNLKYTIKNSTALLGWYDETHILNIYYNSENITKLDVTNNQESIYAPTNGLGFSEYISKTNEFLGSTDSLGAELFIKNLIYNATTNKITYLSKYFMQPSYQTNTYAKFGNKILVEQQLTDTVTGKITLRNYRKHIAIMNADGSDIRQIQIPE